jgi:hypothetical protein
MPRCNEYSEIRPEQVAWPNLFLVCLSVILAAQDVP